VKKLYRKLYDEFVEAIDANDNGISAFPSEKLEEYDLKPRFSEEGITLPSMVAGLNPVWNEEVPDDAVNERFEKASTLMGHVFVEKLKYYANSWLPARSLVLKSLENRFQTDPSGKIINLEVSCPWKEHLFNLEEELGLLEEVLYALYSDGKGWRVQAVPKKKDGFEDRKGLPDVWRGVRDDELSSLSDIDGCVFVHASGFIGGNKTYEGALEMARKALVHDT